MTTNLCSEAAGKYWAGVLLLLTLFHAPPIQAQENVYELDSPPTQAYAAEVKELMSSGYPYLYIQDGTAYGTTQGVANMVCVEATQQAEQLINLPITYDSVRMLHLRIEADDNMAGIQILPATLSLFPQLEYLVFTSRQAIGSAQVAQMTTQLPQDSGLTILYKLRVDN